MEVKQRKKLDTILVVAFLLLIAFGYSYFRVSRITRGRKQTTVTKKEESLDENINKVENEFSYPDEVTSDTEELETEFDDVPEFDLEIDF